MIEKIKIFDTRYFMISFIADFENLRTIYIKRKRNKENEMDLEELL